MLTLSNGSWQKLSQGKVEEIARQLDTSVAKVLTVVAVEARGRGFAGGSGTLIQALFERHKFYSELSKKGDKAKLAKAVALRLANKKPGGYPKTLEKVHDQIRRAAEIDEDAALRATSWGMGQVMGFNCSDVGYESARAMVEAFLTGEDAQIQAMADFIEHNRLDDELRRGDWKGFARGYNGENYRKNDYDGKLERAHARLARQHPEGLEGIMHANADADIVKMGSQGELVGELQRLLNAKGFPVGKVDRDFGTKTKKAVRLFQLDQGLEGTGRVDQETWNRLHAAPDEVQPESRAEATASDLKADSSIVRNGLAVRNVAVTTIGVVGGAKGAEETGLLDEAEKLTQGMGQVNSMLEAAQPIVRFAEDHTSLVLLIALGVVALVASRIVSARVRDHREGRTS